MSKVLCSVATRGRYFTTLPLVLNAIINQTKPVDMLVIFDDTDDPIDLRKEFLYQHIFHILDSKGIRWQVVNAPKKGQHHIHQMANHSTCEWVWRVDDDAIPETNVLENLYKWTILSKDNIGAVGGSVINAKPVDTSKSTGLINNIDSEPNIQWGIIKEPKLVEHLHCTFLYRANVYDYNLGLSRVAHREETLFTYGLHQKGYKLLTVPDAVTWHMKNPEGGIRSEDSRDMFLTDESIFRNFLNYKDHTIVVLNNGIGDHIVFNKILPEIKNPLIFTCYPDIVPGRSIADAIMMFGDLEQWNIYRKMAQWKWDKPIEQAFRKLYL